MFEKITTFAKENKTVIRKRVLIAVGVAVGITIASVALNKSAANIEDLQLLGEEV